MSAKRLGFYPLLTVNRDCEMVAMASIDIIGPAASPDRLPAQSDEPAVGRLPLFRPEALNQRRDKPYGEIILLRPLTLSLLLWLALGLVSAMVAFLIFGQYTNKAHISGVLIPDQGLIKLYAPLPATLLACYVHEGQQVHKGDVLFELSSDKSSLALGSIETEIRNELLSRRQSLIQERSDTLKLSRQQQSNLRDRLDKIRQQQRYLALEIEATQRKLVVAEQMLDRYRQLRSENLISALQLEEKEGEPLEQQKALEELQRSQVALESERQEVQAQLARMPLETQLQVAALERSRGEIEGQLSEHEASRIAVVRAPAEGTVSAIAAETGTTVQPTSALATLVPRQAKLEAHLYAASRAIGFVKPGEKVILRYQAYPSEKFGHQVGVVSQAAQVALSPAEYTFRTGGGSAQEPMYEITVALPSQAVMLYGQPHRLRAGMAVDADVLLDHRRLIEWVFEPLLNLRGRLAA
jgi:membrane fusion protein